MISSARYPLMRSALAFQLAARPSGSSMKMAQSWMLSTSSWKVCSLRFSASCASLRAVKSRVTFANPITAPSESRSAVMITSAQKREPSFRIHPAIARGEREQPRRLSLRYCFGRVKAGEMLPYDLLCPVALDALSAGIPGGDSTRAIQHEDRKILDALDQQAEGLRGFAGGGNGGRHALRQHDEKYVGAYISCKPLATTR